ncbi:MAG: hypothetical protein N2258_06300 [Brevinematales bacterium]|nr:hypothetical protein [Brevinematales bacterium]
MKFLINFLFVFNLSFATSDILSFADKLYSDFLYEEAIHEYKRALFFENDIKNKRLIKLKIAKCYRDAQLFNFSEKVIKEYIDMCEEDEEKYNGFLELGITYLYSTNISMAVYQFLKIENFSENEELKKRALFYLTIGYAMNYQWNEAEESFDRLSKFFPDSEKYSLIKRNIKDLFKRAKKFSYKSPELAKWLSILPGLGQIYAGDLGAGLNALALNGVIFYFTIDMILKANYLDAIFIALSFAERYYSGNFYHAEEKAKKYNEEHNKIFFSEFIDQYDLLSQ